MEYKAGGSLEGAARFHTRTTRNSIPKTAVQRRRSESNRRWEICSLLPYHLATAPYPHDAGRTAMYRPHAVSGSNRDRFQSVCIDNLCFNM